MFRKTIAAGFLYLTIAGGLFGRETRPIQYRLNVSIQPETRQMAVKGDITLSPITPGQSSIKFSLHSTLHIQEIRLAGRETVFTESGNPPTRTVPASKTVTVRVPDGVAGAGVSMAIAYSGGLVEIPEWGTSENQDMALDDTIDRRRVELAGYSNWYPCRAYGPVFDADLKVSLPKGWTVVSQGIRKTQGDQQDREETAWSVSGTPDIVILASPDFKREVVRRGGSRIELYFTRLPAAFVRREAAAMEETFDLFTGILGPPAGNQAVFRYVYSPRSHGQGGFSRPGLVVASEGRMQRALIENPEITTLRGNAHEIAHFWWSFGREQGDWINEAFAEFFGLLAVERIRGREVFDSWIALYRERVADLPAESPSLSRVPAENTETGYIVRYYKGALMLEALRNAMGEDRFLPACAEFHHRFRDGGAQTADFRRFWSEKPGLPAGLLDIWLDR